MCYCSVLQDTDKGPEEGGDMTTIMMERVAAGYGFNVSVSYHLAHTHTLSSLYTGFSTTALWSKVFHRSTGCGPGSTVSSMLSILNSFWLSHTDCIV